MKLLVKNGDAPFHMRTGTVQFLFKDRFILEGDPFACLRGHNDAASDQLWIFIVARPVRIVAQQMPLERRLQQCVQPLDIVTVSGDLNDIANEPLFSEYKMLAHAKKIAL